MTNNNENSKQVLELCDQALQLDDSERQAFLGHACKGDERLRASVDSVLVAISQAGHFLEADSDSEAPVVIELSGRRVGNYQIRQRLGEGGMGSVYLADRHEDGFDQQVAIKFVHAHLLAKELVQRFNAERQILAGLNHPYIAALIDGGTTDDGMPYIVMEYVQGKPIDVYCDEHRLGVRERLRLIQKISLAVQAAHQNLVVHRDLKPSNVLVTADGIPKLLDFGIAKLIEPNASHGNTTVFGRQALTPDYASPEQILENRVTTASDVYSLGVLSYQLLAGQRPYNISSDSHRALVRSVEALTIPPASTQLGTGEATAKVLAIARQRSSTPKRLRRQLAGDLDNILLKALHQAPDRRYGSVAAFSADLERYLKALPVEARPDTFGYRFSRFVSRHRFGVLAGAGVALWSIGFFFETVGDIQLSRFKANPANRGKIMNLGLWRYTRHPNYFGELAQWWGLFLVTLETPWAWLGMIGPLVYSWLIVNVTGQATLDKKLAKEKPGYAEYMQRTSGMIPMPPRS